MIKKYLQFVLVLAMTVVGYSQVAMGQTGATPVVMKPFVVYGDGGTVLANEVGTNAALNASENAGATERLEKACAGPQGAIFCGMAVLSAASIVQSFMAKKSANTTRDKFKNDFEGDFPTPGDTPIDPNLRPPPGGPTTTNTNTNDDGSLSDTERGRWAADANGTLARMKAKGYTFDPKTDTVTTPKGKFPTKAFASGAAMADAGLISPDQVGAIDAALKDLAKDKYRVVSMGVGGGGGGGGGSSYSSPKIVYEDPYAAYGA
jgi:hypothetical protein